MSDLGNKGIFAENLTRYVECSGKTQKEIAEDLGVPYSTFNEWTKGKKYPRMDKVELLANYFSIKKSDLIERKVTEETKKENDELAKIIVRLRTDAEFCDLVCTLAKLDKEQVASAKSFLNAFLK